MFRLFCVLFFLIFLSLPLSAGYVELRHGYVLLCDNTLRNILDDGNFGIQGEAGFSPLPFTAAFINAGFFSKEGRFRDLKKRRVDVTHLSFGGKVFFPFHPCLKIYAGGAIRAIFYHERNAQKHVEKEKLFRVGAAPNVCAGLVYTPYCLPFFVDLFFDYSAVKIHRGDRFTRNRHILLNPLFIGLGVGSCF